MRGLEEGMGLKIALIAPPFIAVPPENYGGTELFVAHLAGHFFTLKNFLRIH